MQDENFHCLPDSERLAKEIWQANLSIETKNGDSFLANYEPEMWTIKKDLVDKIIPCLEAGLENTQSTLAEHDFSLGRTTTKNRMWAETLEQEIRDMKDCIKQLKILDISKSTHYP